MLSLFTDRGREKDVAPLLELSNDLLKIRGFFLCGGGGWEEKAVTKKGVLGESGSYLQRTRRSGFYPTCPS